MAEKISLFEHENLSKVNFARYQTDELRMAIEEILSITGNLAFFIRTVLLVWVTGPIIMPLLFPYSATWVKVMWSFYGALSFFFIAVGLGIFFTKRRLLQNILNIVDIIFEVCGSVLDDLGRIRSRGVGITAVTLVSSVDASVIRPVVEGILRSKLGFLSRPLLWMYEGTIGSIIQVIEKTLTEMAAKEDQSIEQDNEYLLKSGDEPISLIQRAEDSTQRLRDFIGLAQEVSMKAASKITKFAMIPSFLISFVFFLITFLPVLFAKM